MPLPLNQSTKRRSNGTVFLVGLASAAYTVPVELNMETRGGRPTITGACERVSPLRKNRRDSLARRVIGCDTHAPFRGLLVPLPYQGYNQFPEMETGAPEILQGAADYRYVGAGILAAGHIAKYLLDDAFLALRRVGQQLAQLPGAVELRIRQARHLPRRIHLQQHFFRLGLLSPVTVIFGIEQQFLFFAI